MIFDCGAMFSISSGMSPCLQKRVVLSICRQQTNQWVVDQHSDRLKRLSDFLCYESACLWEKRTKFDLTAKIDDHHTTGSSHVLILIIYRYLFEWRGSNSYKSKNSRSSNCFLSNIPMVVLLVHFFSSECTSWPIFEYYEMRLSLFCDRSGDEVFSWLRKYALILSSFEVRISRGLYNVNK
jgi:hypothetical protein